MRTTCKVDNYLTSRHHAIPDQFVYESLSWISNSTHTLFLAPARTSVCTISYKQSKSRGSTLDRCQQTPSGRRRLRAVPSGEALHIIIPALKAARHLSFEHIYDNMAIVPSTSERKSHEKLSPRTMQAWGGHLLENRFALEDQKASEFVCFQGTRARRLFARRFPRASGAVQTNDCTDTESQRLAFPFFCSLFSSPSR